MRRERRAAAGRGVKRLLNFAGIFSLVLGSCASFPEDIFDFKLPPAPDTSQVKLLEPVPEPVPDISEERLSAPPGEDIVMPEPAPEAEVPPGEELAALPSPEPAEPAEPEQAAGPPPRSAVPEPLPPAAASAPPPESPPKPLPEKMDSVRPGPGSPVLPPAASSGAEAADYFPPSPEAAIITTGLPRRVSGIVGRPLTVTLPGIGWIYLQTDDTEGKIRYLGKVMEEGNTVFSFALLEKGDYNLKFQQQDLAANTMRYDDVNLAVYPPETAAQSPQPSPAAPQPQPQQQPPSPPPVPSSPAAALPDAPEAPEENELHRLQRLVQEGRHEAVTQLEKYVTGHQTELENLDELYFSLAGMFEQNSPARDIKKSLLYYEKVRDLFPLSRFWTESDTKSRYIRLNYFDIQ